MDLGLEGKVAIVTGGSRGIGRAAAQALLRAGASVMLASLRKESVEAAAHELALSGKVEGMPCDVASEADVERLVRSEEHTSELQSLAYLVCRLLLEKKKKKRKPKD